MPLRLKIETQGKVAQKKHIFLLNQRAFMESVNQYVNEHTSYKGEYCIIWYRPYKAKEHIIAKSKRNTGGS